MVMIQMARLEGFYWVAATGGYTAAARAFPYPITQPGVHRQVRRLEAELGLKLFERVGRDRVVLTTAGKQLHAFCAPFFGELPSVVRSITSGRHGGKLRMEVAPLEMRHVVPPWAKRLQDRRDDIELELVEVQDPDPRRLLTGEADLVVAYIPKPPPGVLTRTLALHHAFIVLPRSHALAGQRRIRLSDFGDEPFVSYAPGSPERELQQRTLRRAGARPRREVTVSSTEAVLRLVQASLGYSLVAWPRREGPRQPGIKVVPLNHPAGALQISVAWRDRDPPDPLVQAALNAL